jgi:hypothetical protein
MSYRKIAKEAGVSLGTVAADAKAGADLSSAKTYLRWRRKHRESRTSRRREKPVVTKPRAKSKRSSPVVILGDSWPDRLERARAMEKASYRAYLDAAQECDASQLERLQAAHVRAIAMVGDVEQRAAEAELKCGHLVSVEAVKAMIEQMIRPLRTAIDKLPINERLACNPEHPEIAERALNEWRVRMILRARRALAAFDHAENGEYVSVPSTGDAP